MFKSSKARLILLFSVITYCITGLSTLVCTRIIPSLYGLLVSIGITLIAVIIHQIGKRKFPLLYIVSCCLNGIASGFCIGAYYAYFDIHLSVCVIFLLLIPYVLTLYLICLLLDSKEKNQLRRNILGVCILLTGILLIIFWSKSVYCSYGFFCLIIVLFYFLLCVKTLHTTRNILSDLSLASFNFYLLIAIVTAVLVTEGDLADLLDPDIWFHHKKNHK